MSGTAGINISNGVMVSGDGQFVDESELGDEWYFAAAKLPAIPKFAEGSVFTGVLKNA